MNPTPESPDALADEDPRLVGAAQAYLAELEAGRRPGRAEFAARFPGLSEALTPYLDALDIVHGAGTLLPRAAAKPAEAAAPPAEALGDFHIVREVGRGGMGVVYEAVQLSLGRRVALKVLPFAAALDARQLQRFRNEAQAAAQLHHTNIVPVYAVGCERGTHYYAMQLIEGQNLADLIRQLRPAGKEAKSGELAVHQVTTGPYRPADAAPEGPAAPTAVGPAAELSTQHTGRSSRFYRTAARLAVQAADALEHAHELGVVHRDVKPANLIVDGRGNVWVTDFGLAQFQADAGLTQTGALLGTLRYMSPEQAGGKGAVLDHRTDVYSLGATLYELLTLRPIFEGDDRHRLLAQIAADEPRRPRSIDRSIPAELETIVLKAVAKSPADRYQTAREFGDDLRRFLDNRPILARPPSPGQRARKWARRHPSVVAAVVVLCLLTAAGSAVTAYMLRQEQQKTLRRAEQAEKGLQLAQKSADEMIQISEQELAGKPFMEDVRKRMLMSARDYYEGLIAQRGDDPAAQKELAETREHVKKILADLAVLQGGSRLDLLYRDDVQNDLALTAEQKGRLDDLHKTLDLERREGFADLMRLDAEARQERSLDEARAKESALGDILTPQQRKRLDQIALLLRPGLSAFHAPEVDAALKLTAAQKETLRSIEATAFFPGSDFRRGPVEPGRSPEQYARDAAKKFFAALTEEQLKRWNGLTGEPFKETSRVFGPPRGLPPGPRGPRPAPPD